MKYKYNENVISSIKRKYSVAGRSTKILFFRNLQIEFLEPAYPIKKINGVWQKVVKPTGQYLSGHIFSINNKSYIANEDGYYVLEDERGFTIDSLVFPYEDDVLLTYWLDLKISYTTNGEPISDDIKTYPVDHNSFDRVKQYKKILEPGDQLMSNIAITLDNNSYILDTIDIEIDANSIFQNLSQEIVVGNTERLTVHYVGDFSTLQYKGIQISPSTALVEKSNEAIITCYYKENTL